MATPELPGAASPLWDGGLLSDVDDDEDLLL